MNPARLIAALLSLAKNGVPAFGVLVREWTAPGALLLYLGENIVLVLLAALAVRTIVTRKSMQTFFLVAVPFTFGAAVMTLAVIVIHDEYTIDARELAAGFGLMVVFQVIAFATRLRRIRAMPAADAENMLVGVLGRIFLLAFAVWIGLIVAFFWTSAFVIPFVVLKMIVDLGELRSDVAGDTPQ